MLWNIIETKFYIEISNHTNGDGNAYFNGNDTLRIFFPLTIDNGINQINQFIF